MPPTVESQAPQAGLSTPSLDSDSATVRSIRKANFTISQGGPHCVSRATRTLSSAPLAPLDARTIAKLKDLHPPASEPLDALPDRAISIADIDPARLDTILRKRIHNGSAPGLSGTTGSHLLAVWEKATPDGRLGFQLMIRDICFTRIRS